MANKRNHEWPQASAWDGYFTQDKAGGTTQRVDPSLVFARLREEGFLVNPVETVRFALNHAPTDHITSMTYWSQVSKCLRVQGLESGTELELGRELWIRVKNTTGSTLTNGTVISVQSGVDGLTDTVATVVRAISTIKTSCTTLALVTADILDGEEGEATNYGYVRGINTSDLSLGPVYVSPTDPGKLTNTEPGFPNYSARVGVVLKVHATDGIILADPDTDPQFSGGTAVISGGETFPLLMGNSAYSFSLGTNQWGYHSGLFIPKAPIVVSQLSVMCLQVGDFYSMRAGIYSRSTGPNNEDQLLVQTDLRTSALAIGVNTLTLESSLALLPNTEYMLALQISANGTQLAFSNNPTLNPNVPNHFGRADNNPGDPAPGMISSVPYSITADRPWIGVS